VVPPARPGGGLPKVRLHDVRHSYATAALAAGIPAKVVSERLGHENIAITVDTYSHVLPGLDAQAAGTVARLILGDSGPGSQPAADKPLTTGHPPTSSGEEVKGERPGQTEGDRGDSNPRPSGPQPDALTN
jgi:Phage integrase family